MIHAQRIESQYYLDVLQMTYQVIFIVSRVVWQEHNRKVNL